MSDWPLYEFDRQLWRFRADLLRIRDADTLVFLVDTGFRGRHEVAIRLARIDCPEKYTPAGQAATDWLFDVARRVPLWGWRVRSLEQTTFDRWVGEVWFSDGTAELTNLSEALIAAGHGTPRL